MNTATLPTSLPREESSHFLDSFEIENFRAFRKLKLERLGNVNLIVGKNSVGKSSLLDALRLYSERGIPSVTISSRGMDNGQLTRLWGSVTLTPLEGRVVEALRIVHPGVEAVNIVGHEPADLVVNGPIVTEPVVKVRLQNAPEPVPLSRLGDGIYRLFAITLALVNAANGILLIDEIENGLHYSVQLEMWRLIFRTARELNVQVFATTHSWDCISTFQKAASEDDSSEGMLIRLARRNEDIIPTLFDERMLAIATHDQIEIR